MLSLLKLPVIGDGTLFNMKQSLDEMRKEERKQDWEATGRKRRKNMLKKIKRLKERMGIFCCILQKGPRGTMVTQRCRKEEDRTELCSVLCWFKGISATVAATKSELGFDSYQEKEVLNQNNVYAATTDSLIIVLASKAKPRAQPEQTTPSLAFNSQYLHAEHVISKTSFKH